MLPGQGDLAHLEQLSGAAAPALVRAGVGVSQQVTGPAYPSVTGHPPCHRATTSSGHPAEAQTSHSQGLSTGEMCQVWGGAGPLPNYCTLLLLSTKET